MRLCRTALHLPPLRTLTVAAGLILALQQPAWSQADCRREVTKEDTLGIANETINCWRRALRNATAGQENAEREASRAGSRVDDVANRNRALSSSIEQLNARIDAILKEKTVLQGKLDASVKEASNLSARLGARRVLVEQLSAGQLVTIQGNLYGSPIFKRIEAELQFDKEKEHLSLKLTRLELDSDHASFPVAMGKKFAISIWLNGTGNAVFGTIQSYCCWTRGDFGYYYSSGFNWQIGPPALSGVADAYLVVGIGEDGASSKTLLRVTSDPIAEMVKP